MAERPRILLVPMLTELEWPTKPLIEEWAEVASYDPPGVGAEPRRELSSASIVARGIEEIERLGWDGYFLAGDFWSNAAAVKIAVRRPGVRLALATGWSRCRISASRSRQPARGHRQS